MSSKVFLAFLDITLGNFVVRWLVYFSKSSKISRILHAVLAPPTHLVEQNFNVNVTWLAEVVNVDLVGLSLKIQWKVL